MHRILTLHGALFLFLVTAPSRVGADLVDVVNSIRLQGCADLRAVDRPLSVQSQLDEAARRFSRGEPLETATSNSGYRAKRSASIHISTTEGDDGFAQMLALRFCKIVTGTDLRDIGVYRRGNEAWMVLAAPLALQISDDGSTVTDRVLELINEARAGARTCGRIKFLATNPLTRVAALERTALAHAQDMAANGDLAHKGSDGSMPADRATRAGYTWRSVAENVAAGQTTAEAVVATWLNSPGHCANLMSPRYFDTGVAYAANPADDEVIYWVQIFASPD